MAVGVNSKRWYSPNCGRSTRRQLKLKADNMDIREADWLLKIEAAGAYDSRSSKILA